MQKKSGQRNFKLYKLKTNNIEKYIYVTELFTTEY